MNFIKTTITVFAVLVFCTLPSSTSSFIRHHRQHLNLCRECREIQREIITKLMTEIDNSKLCIERNHNYGPIEPNTVTITQDDLLQKIEEFALEIKTLTAAWNRYLGRSMCLQDNIGKYLTRLVCLMRPDGHNEDNCVIQHLVQEPLGYSATLESFVDFLRKLEGTLNVLLDF